MMYRITKKLFRLCILLIAGVAIASLGFFHLACHKNRDNTSPEETLLNIFRMEQNLVEQYQDDYIAYMKYQVTNFPKKNKLTSEAITQINTRFKDMNDDEKKEYQLKWQEKFQPIIDNIYNKTREMIVHQTQNLDTAKMTTIQELSVKMNLIENKAETIKLLPQFFITPTANKGGLDLR